MLNRTDLAIEHINSAQLPESVYVSKNKKSGEFTVNHIKISEREHSKAARLPLGDYITVDLPSLLINGGFFDEAENIISNQLKLLIPEQSGTVLVAGIGNSQITPDALGPAAASRVIATRHIGKALAKQINLSGIKSVAVISAGVLGQTGIETVEILNAICNKIKPKAVIVIDALCTAAPERVGNTVQITSGGISPGSGVKNNRLEISESTLGTKVIAIGVPTVIDAAALLKSKENFEMVVTPKEIDMLIDRCATLIGNAINLCLQPEIKPDILRALV